MIWRTYDSREVWLADRVGRVTGSTAAAVLGLSPWAGPWHVWCQQRDLSVPGPDKTAIFARGYRLEPQILRAVGLEPMLLSAWVGDGIMGTPDYWDGVLGAEVKTATVGSWQDGLCVRRVEDLDLGGLPRHYAVQVYWYLELSGADEWHVYALMPDPHSDVDQGGVYLPYCRLVHVVVQRDATYQRWLLREARSRYDVLLAGEMPSELDTSAACHAALKAAWRRHGERTATTEEAALAERYHALGVEKRGLAQERQCMRNQILLSAEEASRLRWSGGRATITARGSLRVTLEDR